MSYILDALRRADAERERGAVPGLHTQQYGAMPDEDEAPARPWLLIAAVALLSLALAGVIAWNLLAPGPPPARTLAQGDVSESVAAPVMPPTLPPASWPGSTGALPAATPVPPSAVANPAPTAASASAGPTQRIAAAASPAAPVVAEPPRKRPVKKPRKPVADPSEASAAPSANLKATEPVLARADLPEQVRRDLPQLNLGGSSYSSDATSRMVILNGQVFHEGDTIAPGLVLQQVKPKGAVLGFKGYRFKLGS